MEGKEVSEPEKTIDLNVTAVRDRAGHWWVWVFDDEGRPDAILDVKEKAHLMGASAARGALESVRGVGA
jgi:hypothetical protein